MSFRFESAPIEFECATSPIVQEPTNVDLRQRDFYHCYTNTFGAPIEKNNPRFHDVTVLRHDVHGSLIRALKQYNDFVM